MAQCLSAMGPIYEDVDSMTVNPRYLAHKLHITGTDTHTSTQISSTIPSPSSPDICNPLYSPSGEGAAGGDAVYSYAECGKPPAATAVLKLDSCLESDTYELMKPSGSVRPDIDTSENVCYTLNCN